MNNSTYLKELIQGDHCAALLSSAPNIRYYLGIPLPEGALLLVTKNKATVFFSGTSDHRISGVCMCPCQGNAAALLQALRSEAILRLSVEGSIPLRLYQLLEKNISCEIIADLERPMYARRRKLTGDELAAISEAQRITDAVFTESLNYIKAGQTDVELQRLVGMLFFEMGSEMLSYNHVMGCGAATALPHVRPTGRVIQPGDFIMMDIGASIDSYGSDMTRMVGVGRVDDEKRAVYELVRKAQQAAIDCAVVGTVCKEVDAAARSIIQNAGFGEQFLHGLGHSIGLQGLNGPRFNQEDISALTAGLVMTVEPGVYLPGKFGVRIEDMLYIGETETINLTKSTKELLCV